MKIHSASLANGAIVIVCALLSAVLVKQLLGNSAESRPLVPNVYAPGETIPDFAGLPEDRRRALLLYVSSNCRFCTESLPFYRQLARNRQANDLLIVAVSREPEETLQSYLAANDVEVDRVFSIGSREWKLSATPTVLLLDESRRVINAWVGLLGNRESEVETAIAGTRR